MPLSGKLRKALTHAKYSILVLSSHKINRSVLWAGKGCGTGLIFHAGFIRAAIAFGMTSTIPGQHIIDFDICHRPRYRVRGLKAFGWLFRVLRYEQKRNADSIGSVSVPGDSIGMVGWSHQAFDASFRRQPDQIHHRPGLAAIVARFAAQNGMRGLCRMNGMRGL
jgi:hypothetical protein